MVFHDDPTVTFWAVMKKGAEKAAEDLGVDITIQGSLNPEEQVQFVEDLIARGVDGIAVSLANPDAMRDPIAKAIEAGIPVITMNSGVNAFRELGALTHVGQTETVAGEGAGQRFNDIGLTKVLCVIQEEGNIGLEERCDGLEAGFDGEVERFSVASTGDKDLAGTEATIQDKLLSDDSFDGVLALGPDIGVAARNAIDSSGRDDLTLANFDLSPEVLQAIDDGEILFAVDQQQYMQGYLPVVFLVLYQSNANVVGGGLPVLTGPGFV